MKNVGRYPIKSAEEIKKLFEQQNREDQFVFDTMDAYRDNLDEEKLQTVLKRIKDKYDLDFSQSNNQIYKCIPLSEQVYNDVHNQLAEEPFTTRTITGFGKTFTSDDITLYR